MSLSQEDLLQELELLPVWRLRDPVPSPVVEAAPQDGVVEASPQEASAKEISAVEVKPALAAVENLAEKSVEIPQPTHQFRFVASEDAQWGFVLEKQHDDEAEVLLQNMLKAVAVKVMHDVSDATVERLDQQQAKVLVVMGQGEAQALLNSTEALAQLRGKVHQHKATPVIATYSPSELLLQLENKAKAWEDLCLAKATLANL